MFDINNITCSKCGVSFSINEGSPIRPLMFCSECAVLYSDDIKRLRDMENVLCDAFERWKALEREYFDMETAFLQECT